MNSFLFKSLFDKEINNKTDQYFRKTKSIVTKNKDILVTYAIFMRRPVIFCPKLAVDWLRKVEKERETKFSIVLQHKEGSWWVHWHEWLMQFNPDNDFEDVRYDSSLRWIDENNHAVISNGPFYLDRYSPDSRMI